MTNNSTSRQLELFCNRTREREVICDFLSRLQKGIGHEYPSVLSFYGVGGVGKTLLRQKALADFAAGIEGDIYAPTPPKIIEIDLDNDNVRPDMPVAQFLGRVRASLKNQQIQTPLFDYLYLAWWSEENPGQSIDLNLRESKGIGSGLIDVAEIISDLASFFQIELPGIAAVQGVRTLFPKLGEWYEHRSVGQRFGGAPEGWSQTDRVARMPVMLANDLLEVVAHQPQTSICLVIDGFERVQSKELSDDVQRALALLVSEVLRCTETIPLPDGKPLRGRIGFMIFGREKLRWAELYSRERIRTNWQKEIGSYSQLVGLTEKDARTFLIDLAVPWERDHESPKAAQLIEHHTTQILGAASERILEEGASFLPYYLDLAVILIRENANDFEPQMLGQSPAELEIRFLRYIKGEHREALQALAMALQFNRDTFAYLIERGLIGRYAVARFSWLVGDQWSFVTPVKNRPGFHAFHRHMQDSLVGSMTIAEDRDRAREAVQILLERQYNFAQFEVPAEFGLVQEAAYAEAMTLVRTHQSTGLLDEATAVRWVLTFESLFDPAHATYLRRPNLEWAVQIAKTNLGGEHPDTLILISWLALTLEAQGDLVAARGLQEKVLEIHRRVLGEEHADTLTSMGNLAGTLKEQGDLVAARGLQEKVLEGRRRVLGEEHSHTLVSMGEVALIMRAQGDLVAARGLQEKVLEIHRRVLGEEHPNTLTLIGNLAGTLKEQGDFITARGLQEKVLEIHRRVLGEEHPNTLASMSNLALTFQAQGDLAAARSLQEYELKICQRILGEEHPDTLTSMNNLALTFQAQGDLAAARPLHERVLEIRRRILGEEHPDTLTSMNNLAGTLQTQGDLVAARGLQEKVLEIHRRILGEEHPDTLTSMNNLAGTLQTQGDLVAARGLQEKVLEGRRRILGEEHPNTLTSMGNLAETLRRQGDLAAAHTLYERVLEIRRQVLGEENLDTVLLMTKLAKILRAQGDYPGARALQEKVLVTCRRILGEEDPRTLAAMNNLALILREQGNLSGALDLQEKCWKYHGRSESS
jgi:tetratricopeptide (TPR) repeat protein